MNDNEFERISDEFVNGGLHRTDALAMLSECVRLRAELAEYKAQTKQLADHIMFEVNGEPSRSEGAVECAIRLLSELVELRTAAQVTIDAASAPLLIARNDREGLIEALVLTQVGWAHAGPEQFGLKSDDDGCLVAILGTERLTAEENSYPGIDETRYYTVPLYTMGQS